VVAFDAHSVVAEFAFEHAIDLFTDGMQLPAAITGDEQKIVELGSHAAHIEHDYIFAPIVLGRARRRERQLFTSFLTSGKRSRCHSDNGRPCRDGGVKSCAPILTASIAGDEGRLRRQAGKATGASGKV